MNNMYILLLASLSVLSCSNIVAENIVGKSRVELDRDDWSGIWSTDDGIILVDVVDEGSLSNELIVGILGMADGNFAIDTVHVQVRRGKGDVLFFNYLVSDLPEQWNPDYGPEHGSNYIWGGARLVQNNNVLLIYMPRKDFFSNLGLLEQITEPSDFKSSVHRILGDSETITELVLDNQEEALDFTLPDGVTVWSKIHGTP